MPINIISDREEMKIDVSERMSPKNYTLGQLVGEIAYNESRIALMELGDKTTPDNTASLEDIGTRQTSLYKELDRREKLYASK